MATLRVPLPPPLLQPEREESQGPAMNGATRYWTANSFIPNGLHQSAALPSGSRGNVFTRAARREGVH